MLGVVGFGVLFVSVLWGIRVNASGLGLRVKVRASLSLSDFPNAWRTATALLVSVRVWIMTRLRVWVRASIVPGSASCQEQHHVSC